MSKNTPTFCLLSEYSGNGCATTRNNTARNTAHISPCTSFLKVTRVFPNTKLSIWARTTASQYGGGYSQI